MYENRSRRGAGRPACPECGAEPDIATLRVATAEAGAALRRDVDRKEASRDPNGSPAAAGEEARVEPEPELEQEWDAGRLAPIGAEAAYRRGRALMIGGAALAGAALGATVALLLRRRP